MDPLSILREFITAKTPTEATKDEIILDSAVFNRNTPTRFRSHGGKGELYNIEALWFFHKNSMAENYSNYVMECRKKKITAIEVQDIKDLKRYLLSQVDESQVSSIERASSTNYEVMGGEAGASTKKRKRARSGRSFLDSLPTAKPFAWPPDADDVWKDPQSRIRHVQTRNNVMLSSKPLNFSEQEIDKYWDVINEISSQQPDAKRKKSQLENAALQAIKKRVEVPIIIVPPSVQSLLTMRNARSFIEDGKYKPNNKKSSDRVEDLDRPGVKIIMRESVIDSSRIAKFELICDPTKVLEKKEDWKRICAVFALGKEWQFRKWPDSWKNPAYVFHNAAGFYMHWDDTPVPHLVRTWRVSWLAVAKNKRHLDQSRSNDFWKKLDYSLCSHNNRKLFY